MHFQRNNACVWFKESAAQHTQLNFANIEREDICETSGNFILSLCLRMCIFGSDSLSIKVRFSCEIGGKWCSFWVYFILEWNKLYSISVLKLLRVFWISYESITPDFFHWGSCLRTVRMSGLEVVAQIRV